MYEGQTVFAQLMEFLPRRTFQSCIARYNGHHNMKSFTCREQYLAMAFAQLTWRESLRDIETCLRAHQGKLYHMGFKSAMPRRVRRTTGSRDGEGNPASRWACPTAMLRRRRVARAWVSACAVR